jgi:type IV fimbrial biogenesis protein FimT
MTHPNPQATRGFTLIELLITLVIAAILVSLAAPSFRNLILDLQLSNAANDLITDIYLARSEAVTRNQEVVICATTDPMAANPTCLTGGKEWRTGWVVCVENDLTPEDDCDPGEPILARHAALDNRITKAEAGNNIEQGIRYGSNGRPTGEFGNDTITICDTRANSDRGWREVIVNNQGRPRIDAPDPETPPVPNPC